MLQKILIVLVALIAIVIGIGFVLPTEINMERDIVIEAPPATVYTVVSNFSRFNEWSPWAELDPNTVYTYEGPASGVGAKMAWTSESSDVGVGSQEIKAATPYERVDVEMWFEGQGTSEAYYTLEPVEKGTRLVWGFDADFSDNFIGRYFGPMIEGMLGPQYEQGLTSLKTLVEALPDTDFAGLEVEIIEAEPVLMAYAEGATSQDSEDISAALGAAYGKVGGFLAANGIEMAGPPLTVNKVWEEGRFEFDAGIPIAAAPEEISEESEVKVGQTYAGKVAKVVHVGSYEGLEATYGKLEAWLAANGWESAGAPWDVWVSDPGNTPEEELITHIHWPIS